MIKNQQWMEEQGWIDFPDGVMELLNICQSKAYALKRLDENGNCELESFKFAGKTYVNIEQINNYLKRQVKQQREARITLLLEVDDE